MESNLLYQEGLEQFRASVVAKKDKDKILLSGFLDEHQGPQAAKQAAVNLKSDTEKKYGRNFGPIPGEWIGKIMGNIDRAIDVGDFATKGAPESVGMAWMVIKLTLGAIRSNYQLYTLFGVGLMTVTEVMMVIPHYEKLYYHRGYSDQEMRVYMDGLFSDMRDAYAATLMYCFTVKKHITSSKARRAAHIFKDFFGAEQDEYQAQVDDMVDLKKKVIENSYGAFQTQIFDRIDGLDGVISALRQDIKSVMQFTEIATRLQQNISTRIDASETHIIQRVDSTGRKIISEISAIKPKTPWEMAVDKYEYLMRELNPVQGAADGWPTKIKDGLEERMHAHDPTQHEKFKTWKSSDELAHGMLVLWGKEGSGKTTYASALYKNLYKEGAQKHVFLVWKSILPQTAEDSFISLDRMIRTLLAQFLEWIRNTVEGETQNADLLQRCIAAFRGLRQTTNDRPSTVTQELYKLTFSFINQIRQIIGDRMEKLFLIIDAADVLGESEQLELFEQLVRLPRAALKVKTLITCALFSHFYGAAASSWAQPLDIDIAQAYQSEMRDVLEVAMRDLPKLSSEVTGQVKDHILKQAKSRFKYLLETAIPYLRQPYQGSILDHIRGLPSSANPKYMRAVQSLTPGSLGLLRTTLSMALYAIDGIKAQEIFDAFTGIYVASEEDQVETVPDLTSLQIEQLRVATESFLQIFEYEGTYYAYTGDFPEIRDFCHTSVNEPASENETLCTRCANQIHAEHSLSWTERDWHLDMTIRCLRHLNSRLFQKTFGLLPGFSERMPERSQTAGQIEAGTDHGAGDNGKSVEDGALERTTTSNKGPTNTETDDTDSVINESGDEVEDTVTDTASDVTSNMVYYWQNSRYEIHFWPTHLYKAQELWPDREERNNDPKWQLLIRELDKFALENESVFALWQKVFFRYNKVLVRKRIDPWKPLHVAACLGLACWAEHLMEKHAADPNEISYGRNPLQTAAKGKADIKVLELLLSMGADPNLDSEQFTAFHWWMWRSPGASLEVVDLLLRHGADPSKVSLGNHSLPLHSFARAGQDVAPLERMLNPDDPTIRPDINAQNIDGETPLHILLKRAHVPVKMVRAFIDRGASINIEDKFSQMPLQLACERGEPELVKLLLENNRDVNDPNTSGRTAMHTAAKEGHDECITMLLEAGVRAHETDHHGRTPFFFACMNETGETAQHLLEILTHQGLDGCEINKPTAFGQTPLREAAKRGLTDVVAGILKTLEPINASSKVNIDLKDTRDLRTALFQAAKHGYPKIVSMLIGAGADVTICDRSGNSPLDACQQSWALASGDALEETVCLLIDNAPASATQNREIAATAASNGSVKVLEHLQAVGVDLTAKDCFGWTPLDLAQQLGQQEVEKFLRGQRARTRLLPIRWIGNRESTKLSADGLVMTHTRNERYCVSTDRPLPPGIEQYYFEIRLERIADAKQEEYPEVAIGFCTHGASTLGFPGWRPKSFAHSARSWAYHGDDGVMHDGNPYYKETNDPARRYKTGDTVGAGFHSAMNVIWFTRNGKLLQPMFTNVSGRMFPVIGLRHAVEIHTNFGSEDFLWNGEITSNGNVIQEELWE